MAMVGPLCTPHHIVGTWVVMLLLADVHVVNKANKTAAELATENGKAWVAKFIAEYKADANIRK
jgi:hypothetical protein